MDKVKMSSIKWLKSKKTLVVLFVFSMLVLGSSISWFVLQNKWLKVSGSHMPNFMYMPIFESVEQRNAQWKRFGDDSVWKDISTRPENENKVSVSHIDSILMHATEYSDF
jgi:hypothetical protein